VAGAPFHRRNYSKRVANLSLYETFSVAEHMTVAGLLRYSTIAATRASCALLAGRPFLLLPWLANSSCGSSRPRIAASSDTRAIT